ncbi:hypothetical protein ACFQZE_06540 [Paenibacillus sp. GCM10027627]|uniref:hypothetical protein n=1 Tax=unclassified Paenibacillus TaxID=185978 RepID=UPI00363DB05A
MRKVSGFSEVVTYIKYEYDTFVEWKDHEKQLLGDYFHVHETSLNEEHPYICCTYVRRIGANKN